MGPALRQPDRRSCGAAVAVRARMLRPGAPALAPEQFGAEVLRAHADLTRWGRTGTAAPLQAIGWLRALGTPPWRLAEDLARTTGVPYAVTWARWGSGRRDRTWESLTAASGPAPVAAYVGSRWLPRHVVLALDAVDADADGRDEVLVYEPSRGTDVVRGRAEWLEDRLSLGGWDHPWAVVAPRAPDAVRTGRRAPRTRA